MSEKLHSVCYKALILETYLFISFILKKHLLTESFMNYTRFYSAYVDSLIVSAIRALGQVVSIQIIMYLNKYY